MRTPSIPIVRTENEGIDSSIMSAKLVSWTGLTSTLNLPDHMYSVRVFLKLRKTWFQNLHKEPVVLSRWLLQEGKKQRQYFWLSRKVKHIKKADKQTNSVLTIFETSRATLTTKFPNSCRASFASKLLSSAISLEKQSKPPHPHAFRHFSTV